MTVVDEETVVIDHLDFSPGCECRCHEIQATSIPEAKWVIHWNQPSKHGCETGNKTSLWCDKCHRELTTANILICKGCGGAFTMSDFVERIEPL